MSGTTIIGYAAVFDSPSVDMGFIETIDAHAFDNALRTDDVRGLFNHDPNLLLGRTSAGTLRLSTDSVGLRYEIDVNTGDPDGVAALAKVARGDCSGSSFSFNTIRDQWDWSATPPTRRLLEVTLLDVSPVSYPAYPATTATARSFTSVAPALSRAGKVLSAASKAKVAAAIEQLQDLLALAGEFDVDDTEADALIAQALEKDSVSDALEKDALELPRSLAALKRRSVGLERQDYLNRKVAQVDRNARQAREELEAARWPS